MASSRTVFRPAAAGQGGPGKERRKKQGIFLPYFSTRLNMFGDPSSGRKGTGGKGRGSYIREKKKKRKKKGSTRSLLLTSFVFYTSRHPSSRREKHFTTFFTRGKYDARLRVTVIYNIHPQLLYS